MTKIQRISMQDVAERAGVSRMTVSRALSSHSEISEKTRERIARIAADMGYRSNPLVSALMANLRSSKRRPRTGKLAYLTTHSNDWRRLPILDRFYTGALQHATDLGFALQEFNMSKPGMTETRMSEILWTRNIHGILVAPAAHSGYELAIDWDRFSSVTIGYSVVRPNLHRVLNHQIHSLRTAMERSRELGYRRPGLVMERQNDARVDHNWTMAFLGCQCHLPVRARLPILNPETVDFENFKTWFRRNRPDVVLATITDARARITGCLTRLGLDVPDDVGFITLHKDRLDDDTSGIYQNPELVGEVAVELLTEQIYHNYRGIPKSPRVLLIEGDWVEGKTLRDQT